MRLIIAGGRDFNNRAMMENALKEHYSFSDLFEFKPFVSEIVEGEAPGADTLARLIGLDWGIKVTPFPADWDKYGDSAGRIRNKQMRDYGHMLLAFWDGFSDGTKHMISIADKCGMPYKVIKYDRSDLLSDKIDLIFDWETVGIRPTTAVASLGIIPFNRNEYVSFNELVNKGRKFKFNVSEQFKIGRTYDKDTVEFWKSEENKDAFDKVIATTGEEISLNDFPAKLESFLYESGYKIDENVGGYIWNRGNAFDAPIMDNIFDSLNRQIPYPFWMLRDVRTYIDANCSLWDNEHEGYGYVRNFEKPEEFIKHVELHDCAFDIMQLQYAHLKTLEWAGKLEN